MDRLVYLASSVFIILLLLASESSENINWQFSHYFLTHDWLVEGKKDDNHYCCCCDLKKTKIFLQHDQGIDGSRLNYERVYYCDDYDHNFPHHPSFVIIGGAVIWVIRSNDSSQRGDSGDRKQPEVAAQTKMMRATIKNSKVRITAVKKNPKSLRTSGIRLRKAKEGTEEEEVPVDENTQPDYPTNPN